MEKESNCIRFDWAAKYILRDKADFVILEGFVSAILDEKIAITELLESESNQKAQDDKYNRVDIKAINSKGDIILIEIQQSTEHYFLQRVLFGLAKTITEHFKLGEHYNNVKKVYSINILYFDFGKGDDYLYHGYNTLVGVNTGDQLKVTAKERQGIKTFLSERIFPEYYILRVEKFDKEETHSAREEWMRYLNCGYIDPNTTVHGLREAFERLQELKMTVGERKAYERHLENISYQVSVLDSARIDGRIEGRKEGREEGRLLEREELISKMREVGIDEGTIQQLIKKEESDRPLS